MHTKFLDSLKKEIKATFVAYKRRGSNYSLVIRKNGKEDEFRLVGTPQDVTPQRYLELRTQIMEYYA